MPSNARLLIHPALHPSLGENINGPSLIRVPDWIEGAMGRYYLYFAHHQGKHIRLAASDNLLGPYQVHPPGVLSLEVSGFPTQRLVAEQVTDPGILRYFEQYGIERILPFFPPHVASPDVHVHHDTHEIWIYYHGQIETGQQLTKLARSTDGVHFTPEPGFLGNSYFRVFLQGGVYYALSHRGATLNRSDDGVNFEAGPQIGEDNVRHTAVRRTGAAMFEVYWSRFGDAPEHILVSELDVSGPWRSWKLGEARSVRRPEFDWEGADLEIRESTAGFAAGELHELRDPGIFEEEGRTYLLYSVRGESGIAICELP